MCLKQAILRGYVNIPFLYIVSGDTFIQFTEVYHGVTSLLRLCSVLVFFKTSLRVVYLSFYNFNWHATLQKKNSVALVRKRTMCIPTERPPLVGEVIVNFSG
jgi:hypothetical protein